MPGRRPLLDEVCGGRGRWSQRWVSTRCHIHGDLLWRRDRHCLPTRSSVDRPLGTRAKRPRTLSLLGPLLRLLGRLDPRDAAAYEEAAREAFKAATPTDVPATAPAVNAVDSSISPVGPAPVPPAPSAFRQGATTTRRSGSLGSKQTARPLGPDSATREGAAIDGSSTEQQSPEAVDATTDLLQTPRSVTPVADDFFDGLIRRVEGEL